MISIHQLHLGTVRLPETHPRFADGHCPINSYVIDHPDGLIVIDTGPRAGHPVIDELYAPQVISIIDALNAEGFDERDVSAVVNTHLHFDHCGQNHLLAPAPIWVSPAELQASAAELYTVPEWAAIDPDRLRLANDGEILAEGVTILHTPGHTPGHVSVTAETGIGREIVIGQACYSCAEFESGTAAVDDMHEPDWHNIGLASVARLQSLQPTRAHFSHDGTTHVRP